MRNLLYCDALRQDVFARAREAPIRDVIRDLGGIELHRRGRSWVGLCPFHQEKTPSFTVTPEKQMFFCFGCGVGGDSVSFIAKLHGLRPIEAAKMICRHFGLPVDDDPAPAEAARARREAEARRRRLEKLNAGWTLAWLAATAYYRVAARANQITDYTDPVLMQAELEADVLLRALEDPEPATRLEAVWEVLGGNV